MTLEDEKIMSPLEGISYVITDGERFLITKRIKENSNFKGQFLFPAGLIEDFDVSREAAVKREVEEERGVLINDCTFLKTTTFLHPNGSTITQHIFLIRKGDCDGEVGNLEPEKEELHWLTPMQLKSVCTSERAKAVLKVLEEKIF